MKKTDDIAYGLSAQSCINQGATKFATPGHIDLIEAQRTESWDKVTPDQAFVVNPG
jgi:hypothetical protein